ncbi:MAG: preprotein translocase subunit SecG [Arcobacter sp.]|jgi:preprotein translocase subunit SecG|uniref:preprotein translocase subunit SecG n=1 Tax=Arcobacter sp. TaxID=1872629 RepID=UPI00258F91E6|nr:preprotein translocase subunit SecG [Arcobacter sp.]MDD3007226.1 preprotein translocase subunit SecG [Arcobacter sp.]MDY3205577.1 preprotein translocase subunit SecG [Arcobacter sp.]
MTSTLLIVQFVLAILLTIIVLLQKSSSIGLGAYSGSNDSLFGAKGPANFLTKATMALGLVFVINTVALGYLYNQQRNQSAVDSIKTDSLIPATPVTQTDSAPAAPTATPTPTVPENK